MLLNGLKLRIDDIIIRAFIIFGSDMWIIRAAGQELPKKNIHEKSGR